MRDRFSTPSTYRRGSLFRGLGFGTVATAIVAVLLILVIGGCSVMKGAGEGRATITVTEKFIKRSGDSDNYMVNGRKPDGKIEVFQNTDSMMYLKTDSADLQAALEVGKTYDCKTWGWRVSFFSANRNLINCTEVR